MEVESNFKPVHNSSDKSMGSTHSRNRNRNVCLAVIAVLLLLVLILAILAFTVFKAKSPQIKIDSVGLSDFLASFDVARFGVNLNLTLAVGLSVKNPNKVGFKYKNSSALLRYHGNVVGEVPIPEGKISARETKPMNLSLVLMGDRFISDSTLYSDFLSGTLPLNAFTRISGMVRILFVNVHVVSSTSCDLVVDVGSGTIGNQNCKHKTQL